MGSKINVGLSPVREYRCSLAMSFNATSRSCAVAYQCSRFHPVPMSELKVSPRGNVTRMPNGFSSASSRWKLCAWQRVTMIENLRGSWAWTRIIAPIEARFVAGLGANTAGKRRPDCYTCAYCCFLDRCPVRGLGTAVADSTNDAGGPLRRALRIRASETSDTAHGGIVR